MNVLAVCHKLPTADHPGTMASVARQIDSLRQLGITVDVLELNGRRKLKYAPALNTLLRMAKRFDIIHAHFGYCGWLARLQLRRPVVISFMGDDLLGTPGDDGRIVPLSRVVVRINRWLARRVNAVIVKSAEMARVIAPTPAYVIPNGVDLALFRPMARAEAAACLGWTTDRPYVLFPGDPRNPRKGYDLAAAAVARARQLFPDRAFELIPLSGVQPDRVPLYMNACAAMLMTSFIEGSPNVVKEAMACNMPVVAVPVGDVSELLAGVENCAVCPRDPEQIALNLARVAGSQSDGRLALQHKRLDLESVARRIVEIYEQVLGETN